MKKYISALTILLFSTLLLGQPTQTKKVVAKVKDTFRIYCQDQKITIPDFQYLENSMGITSIKKLFPMVKKPATITNKQGDTLVDISLIYEFEINAASPIDVICRQLITTNWFEYVEPKNTHQLLHTPNDPNIVNQYYLTNIRAFSGWDICRGDSTIVVGITDTGFDFTHSDLIGAVAYNLNDPIDGIDNDNDGYIDNYKGWDMAMNDNNPQYSSSDHGVLVSALVGARTNNGMGMASVGYNTKILPIKVINDNNIITSGYEAIVYGASHGCSIVNCSWGGQITDGKFGEDIINFATYNCNTLVVAACGNSNNELPFWPATYRNVTSVCATDLVDAKAGFSTFGWDVDIAAPGNGIYSACAGNSYKYDGGTSYSSPITAACAAIVKSYFSNLTALQIAERLKVTADNIDTIAQNSLYVGKLGYGRLNLFRALTDIDIPSIKYDSPQFSSNCPINGDTILFNANFKNLLKATEHLKISLSVMQGYATLVDSVISVATLSTFQSYNNQNQPFKFVLGNNSPNIELVLKLTYTDTNYVGYEYVQLYVSKTYLDIDTNHIATTFTGNSRLGFADDFYHQGFGFNYLGSNQLFYMGGLMIGKNTDCVSDNVYGETGSDFDFMNMVHPVQVFPSTVADYEAYTQYNDNGALGNRMNLQVTHRVYAWDQPECENFIVHSFTVKNSGATPQTGVYIGMFVDWDIYLSVYNRAKYDPQSKLIYAWCPYGGKFGGISALSPLPVNKYAFDNNGTSLSLKISDGFSGIEKFTALTSNRDSAGYAGNGNDISTLLNYLPIDLNPNDSITLNFALVAGNTPHDLTDATTAAISKLNGSNQINAYTNQPNSFRAYPNPASNKLFIDFSEPIIGVEMVNLMGKKSTLSYFYRSKSSLCVDVSNYSSGLYLLVIQTPAGKITQKIIINH